MNLDANISPHFGTRNHAPRTISCLLCQGPETNAHLVICAGSAGHRNSLNLRTAMKLGRLELGLDPPNGRFSHVDADHTTAPLRSSIAHDRKYRILCVDDEVIGTQIRGEILEQIGYSVALCHRPSEVLSRDLTLFDLGILDFEMPEFNGRELLLRMRSLGARFPIVLFSGYVDTLSCEDRVLFTRCIDKAKPIQHLLDTIAELLDPAFDFGS